MSLGRTDNAGAVAGAQGGAAVHQSGRQGFRSQIQPHMAVRSGSADIVRGLQFGRVVKPC